jgi:hypothetical protein
MKTERLAELEITRKHVSTKRVRVARVRVFVAAGESSKQLHTRGEERARDGRAVPVALGVQGMAEQGVCECGGAAAAAGATALQHGTSAGEEGAGATVEAAAGKSTRWRWHGGSVSTGVGDHSEYGRRMN